MTLGLLCGGFKPNLGFAQSLTHVGIGTRVRVEVAHENRLVIGEVWRLTRDTLEVKTAGRLRPFARSDIHDLEMSRGRGNRALVGAVGGLLGGAAVGGVLGYAFCADCTESGTRLKGSWRSGQVLAQPALWGAQ